VLHNGDMSHIDCRIRIRSTELQNFTEKSFQLIDIVVMFKSLHNENLSY
jgi:hypothetical protein